MKHYWESQNKYVSEDTLTQEDVARMVEVFTQGDCIPLAVQICESDIDRYYLMVACYKNGDNDYPEYAHALAYDSLNDTYIDIEGSRSKQDILENSRWSHCYDIGTIEEMRLEEYYDEEQMLDFTEYSTLRLYDFPMNVAMDYLRKNNWIGQ